MIQHASNRNMQRKNCEYIQKSYKNFKAKIASMWLMVYFLAFLLRVADLEPHRLDADGFFEVDLQTRLLIEFVLLGRLLLRLVPFPQPRVETILPKHIVFGLVLWPRPRVEIVPLPRPRVEIVLLPRPRRGFVTLRRRLLGLVLLPRPLVETIPLEATLFGLNPPPRPRVEIVPLPRPRVEFVPLRTHLLGLATLRYFSVKP